VVDRQLRSAVWLDDTTDLDLGLYELDMDWVGFSRLLVRSWPLRTPSRGGTHIADRGMVENRH
jgi:hypothetical protein